MWYDHYVVNPNYIELQAWFSAVDQDRNGEITALELSAALSTSQRNFSESTAKMLVRIFDKDKSGKISFNEFIPLHCFVVAVENNFRAADRDKSGSINYNELQVALNLKGMVTFSPNSLLSLFQRYDKYRDGRLRLDEFVELTAFLAFNKSVFEWYDKSKRGSITLSFQEFVDVSLLFSTNK